MSDLEFLTSHVPGYGGYSDEEARNDTDSRVRAFVGGRLQQVRDRLAAQLGGAESDGFEKVLLRCQFGDQAFIKSLDNAQLDEAQEAALIAHDRVLIDLAERLEGATLEQAAPLVTSLAEAFDQRKLPQAV